MSCARANFGRSPTRRWASRRGAAVAITVLILGLMNLLLVSSISASGDDARLAGARTDTVSCFYAAESGAAVVLGEYAAARTIPTGISALPDGATVTITSSGTSPMTVTIVGSKGQARRELKLTIQ